MPIRPSLHGAPPGPLSRPLPRARTLAGALALCLAAVGCDGEPPPAEPPVPAGTTGHLVLLEGTLAFRPCGAEEARPVEDGTGRDLARVVEDLGYGDGEVRAHVVLAGDRVTELRVAAPEAPTECEALLPDGDLQARGNEPFWGVTVAGTQAVWRSPDELDGETYDEGSWTREEGGWRYDALRYHADGVEHLVVRFFEGPCGDSMSGAHYPFRAETERGGTLYEGCGMEGRGRSGDGE